MADELEHRGPDDAGVWSDMDVGIVFGHRRLAIQDLSAAGHQPMISDCGRYVLNYNGEIYNHRALRSQLRKKNFCGSSDTETLLACIAEWGIERTLVASVGMFALAVWNRETRTLALARDRFGEKPLYFGWQGPAFLFGSELKALRRHPAFRPDVDQRALALLMRHGYVPAPHSIYRGVSKLLPGTYLTLKVRDGMVTPQTDTPRSYWALGDVIERASSNTFRGSVEEAASELDHRLRESVRGQLLSDVPVGAFLSGGIDSSAIVSVMQAESSQPVRTFTIGFREKEFDEAGYARPIAEHLGTDHTELYVSSQDAIDVIPELPRIYCEPFADSSQIPTVLLSRLTRRHVTVALSGDGGDELFGGYTRYLWARRMKTLLNAAPRSVRQAMARGLRSMSPTRWTALARVPATLLPAPYRINRPGEQIHKFAELLTANSDTALYRHLISLCKNPASLLHEATELPTLLDSPADWPAVESFELWMMAMDSRMYLPDDILVKVDRAAMAASLETRVPFLDHRVAELAWTLPFDHKIQNGTGKRVVRALLQKYIPSTLLDRPKMGFGIPLAQWLRGSLRPWAEDLLSEQRLKHEGFFKADAVGALWRSHLQRTQDTHHQLWPVLMFQAWLESQRRDGTSVA